MIKWKLEIEIGGEREERGEWERREGPKVLRANSPAQHNNDQRKEDSLMQGLLEHVKDEFIGNYDRNEGTGATGKARTRTKALEGENERENGSADSGAIGNKRIR